MEKSQQGNFLHQLSDAKELFEIVAKERKVLARVAKLDKFGFFTQRDRLNFKLR